MIANRLTKNERKVFVEAKNTWLGSLAGMITPLERATWDKGYMAGLSHNQAKLDKLISYIKGEITRSEIEDLLQ